MVGPLQETSNGNKYTVAITDHFSKWTWTNNQFVVYITRQCRHHGGIIWPRGV